MHMASYRLKRKASSPSISREAPFPENNSQNASPPTSTFEDTPSGISVIDTRQASAAMQLQLEMHKARIEELESEVKDKAKELEALNAPKHVQMEMESASLLEDQEC